MAIKNLKKQGSRCLPMNNTKFPPKTGLNNNPTPKKAYQNPPINIQNIKELYLLIKILELLNQLLKKQLMHNQDQPPKTQSPKKQTLANLIDSIDFNIKKNKTKSTVSDGDSISSGHSIESKEKSKVWTEEEIQWFHILLKKHGTDFHILSNFFPKKTKNQLKNRYKQYMNAQRKREKQEVHKLRAMSELFKEVQQKEQYQKIEEEPIKKQQNKDSSQQ